jgi:hypothetical protein
MAGIDRRQVDFGLIIVCGRKRRVHHRLLC